jgi:hypothetical protein
MLLLPLTRRRSSGDEGRRAGRARTNLWIVYFAGLGFGFIVVEVTLIQRFNLFLGYPLYSLAAVLFTVLLASGVGSLAAGRWRAASALPSALAALCVVLLLYVTFLSTLLVPLWGFAAPARVGAAVALCAPVGLLMGVAFPTGLRRVAREDPALVSWAWALNGASSVLGSVATTVVAMSFGFGASLGVGIVAYGAALVACLALGERRAPEDETRPPQSSSDRCHAITASLDTAPPVNP